MTDKTSKMRAWFRAASLQRWSDQKELQPEHNTKYTHAGIDPSSQWINSHTKTTA